MLHYDQLSFFAEYESCLFFLEAPLVAALEHLVWDVADYCIMCVLDLPIVLQCHEVLQHAPLVEQKVPNS